MGVTDVYKFSLVKKFTNRKHYTFFFQFRNSMFSIQLNLLTRKLNYRMDKFSKIICLDVQFNVIWQNECPDKVLEIVANDRLLICGTKEGSVYFFSSTSEIGVCQENFVFTISKDGKFFLWYLDQLNSWNSRNIYKASVRDLSERGNFLRAWFHEQIVIIMLSNDALYTFHQNLRTWLCIDDQTTWASEYRFEKLNLIDIRSLDKEERLNHSLTDLESKIFNCLLFKNSSRFKELLRIYLMQLIKYPVLIPRLEEVCLELLNGDLNSKDPIFNLEWRLSLLKSVLPLMTNNLSLEHLVEGFYNEIKLKEGKKDTILLI